MTKAEQVGQQVHANHIVMRNYQKYFDAETRKALDDSKDLLRKADVDPFDVSADDFKARGGKNNIENFAWAINNYKDIHQKKYVMEVYRRLQEGWNAAGKAGVRAELQKMRIELHRGNDFWNK